MVLWKWPAECQSWIAQWAECLHAHSARHLAPLLLGMLLAQGRRTVASWLRAGGLSHDFQVYYYFVAALGRAGESLAAALLQVLLRQLEVGERLLFALDDTPTKRYGPHVQGAGIHHNPTPGPTDQKFVYGHIWVTLAWVLRHRLWDTIGLPLLAKLYVRQKDVDKIAPKYRWAFQTKLELAADLVTWLMKSLRLLGKSVWVVVDGFYAKKPFLEPATKAGVVVVGRLRKDAALWSVPRPVPKSRRKPGRPRIYGKEKFSLAKRASQKRGWQTVTVKQYAQERSKRIKTFEATWKPAGGPIRVVLVQEEHGWLAFFSTDATVSAEAILEAAADRAAIEQDFHDLKEVEGAGQQQVRNIWANVGAFNVNLWLHTLTELWAWAQPKPAICDRRDAPYDDPDRRPSHADRRKALRRSCIEAGFSRQRECEPWSRKTQTLLHSLLRLAG